MSHTLLVIVASTRPGRIGRAFGDWTVDFAQSHSDFDVQLADLAEIDLPLYDEPEHPRFGNYQHEHTKAWAKIVGGADAFVFVTNEYNHSFNAALKNALDYLGPEWRGKPAAFFSYGGASAGLRATNALDSVLACLGIISVQPAISVPFAMQYVKDGVATLPDAVTSAGPAMLAELQRMTDLLRPAAQ